MSDEEPSPRPPAGGEAEEAPVERREERRPDVRRVIVEIPIPGTSRGDHRARTLERFRIGAVERRMAVLDLSGEIAGPSSPRDSRQMRQGPGPRQDQRDQGAVKKHGKRSGRGRGRRDNQQPSTSRYSHGDGRSDHKESLKQVIARKKREMQQRQQQQQQAPAETETTDVEDPYANAQASIVMIRGRTGICYDFLHKKHYNTWDPNHPENPARATSVNDRMQELHVPDLCEKVDNDTHPDLADKIALVHTKEHYNKLKNICSSNDTKAMESEASRYDSVYFNSETFKAACRAVSATLHIVMGIAADSLHNGMAVVRPPGHHAMESEFNGYCFFNNVAIAAEACIKEKLVSKVLIVDFDVHHGQGTQRFFYDRKDVLYFSIHRYEHGTFWPNLLDGNFNYIGKGDGIGYNVNVPLNAVGLTDDDYLAIIFYILLPIAYEFNPDLVILSAGYDSAIGCPEGRMNVTPGFYSHLIGLLSGLAKGKLAVVLEGGYFLPTLAEGASMTLKALLGGPCPLLEPIRNVHPAVVQVICDVRRMLMNRWGCFAHCETIPLNSLSTNPEEHKFMITYYGEDNVAPFPTRDCYPRLSNVESVYYKKLNLALREKYKASVGAPIVYVYDDTMLLHKPQEGEFERPERPERLSSIINMFAETGLDRRLVRIPMEIHDYLFYSVHAKDHLRKFESFVSESNDIYVNDYTEPATLCAVSSVLTVVDSIMEGTARAGLAIVRPPGHHAEHDKAMGFCFVNNVAIAANYLKMKYQCNRILIVDFDIHHGNGTQNIFYSSKEVMYISIHRDDSGKFFPPESRRNYTDDGHGPGKGFNINIPFNKDKMGDAEYLAAFHNIILPAAYSYAPKMILVSAGFDAGINDPLGGYQVSPEIFGQFIYMLQPLAEGRMVVVLEGGYNLTTTSYAMSMCAKALLGDPIIIPDKIYKSFSKEARKTINNVTEHLKQYYDVFKVNKKLSLLPLITKKIQTFTPETLETPVVKELDIERVEYSDYVEQEIRRFSELRLPGEDDEMLVTMM